MNQSDSSNMVVQGARRGTAGKPLRIGGKRIQIMASFFED